MISERGAMKNLPSLPTGMGSGAAALWAANTLMLATLERRWPVDEVRQLLMVLAILTSTDETEASIRADFEAALVQVQARRAAKQ